MMTDAEAARLAAAEAVCDALDRVVVYCSEMQGKGLLILFSSAMTMGVASKGIPSPVRLVHEWKSLPRGA